jgi:hypothetical protein
LEGDVNSYVIEVGGADLEWPFESTTSARPRFRTLEGKYSRTVAVDPCPAYSHDPELVKRLVRKVTELFPLRFDVYFYVPKFEVLERVNGWASPGTEWNDGKEVLGTSSIILSGKRIPLHPAMTRYLVPHEYGHLVEVEIREHLGFTANQNKEFDAMYRALRDDMPPEPENYGAGTWHLSTGEIFANDFRILVGGLEAEFWPHAGIPSPSVSPRVIEWWAERVREIVLKPEQSVLLAQAAAAGVRHG